MDKKTIFRADKLFVKANGIRAERMTFNIEDNVLSLIRCSKKDFLLDVITGKVLPVNGSILLGGVNVSRRCESERRIAVIPSYSEGGKTYSLLKKALSVELNGLCGLEVQIREKENEIASLKSDIKASRGNKDKLEEKLKQAGIDLMTLKLKIKHRKAELDQNVKTVKSLIKSVKRDNLVKDKENVIARLKAKEFSTQLEYAQFTHKPLPEGAASARVKAVISELSLPDVFEPGDIRAALCEAYVKAPQLMLYTGEVTGSVIAELKKFVESTGVAVAALTDTLCDGNCESIVDIADSCFPK